ncbi:hypothetical protein K8I61_10090 [bacterium]|nr:hypothetical protein [bacterium]
MRRVIVFALLTAAAAMGAVAVSCAGDTGGDEVHWFNCRPVLERVAECGVLISLDDKSETSGADAYESCQFAKGNLWREMYRCYKKFRYVEDSCDEFVECLPDHGFWTPEEQGLDDDSADDDTSDDDTADDDDTIADDDADDDTTQAASRLTPPGGDLATPRARV